MDDDASLDDLVTGLVAAPSSTEKAITPEQRVVGTRSLTSTLRKLSGVFRHSRDHFETYKANTDKSSSELNKEFEAFTNAVLAHEPFGRHQTLGDQLHDNLSGWLGERAYHLDSIHERARDVFADLRDEQPVDHLVFRFEHLNDNTDSNDAQAWPLNNLPQSNPAIPTPTPSNPSYHQTESFRRDNMHFPTEQEAHQHLQQYLQDLAITTPRKARRIKHALRRGELRITSENHSVFTDQATYDPNQPEPKLISRTKQGQIGDIASEPLKIWKTMFGERDTFSYDSIALWSANMDVEDNIRFLLGLAHSPNTVAGNGDATQSTPRPTDETRFNDVVSYVQDGYRITAKNHTPGSPFDFHRRAAHIAQRQPEYEDVREIARLQVSDRQQEAKREMTYDWAVGNDSRVPGTLAKLYEETLTGLRKDYEAFRDAVISPRDADLVRNGDNASYSFKDTMLGWKGELITQFQRNGQCSTRSSKAGEVNVPLEIMIGDEPPYRNGAGWYSGADGPGRGNGNHAGYKAERLATKQYLQENGLYGSYQAFAKHFPTVLT